MGDMFKINKYKVKEVSNKLSTWFKVGCVWTALMGMSLGVAWATTNEASSQAIQNSANSANSVQSTLPLANVELNIGMSQLPPFAFLTDSVTEVQGIDVDIVRELQKRTGFKIKGNKISFMRFGEMLDQGRDGNLDIVASGITLSEARREFFDFSEPYLAVPFVMVARADDNINNVQDLRNRVLATEAGSVATDFLPNAEQLNIKQIVAPSIFMCLFEIHNRTADAMLVDEPMANFYIQTWHNSNLKIVQAVSKPSAAGFLFKKNATFTPYLQAAFADMLADGTIANIFAKYMGQEQAQMYINYVKPAQGEALSFNESN